MPRKRELTVGLVVLVALAVLAVGVFLIGERSQLFRRTNHYSIFFDQVSGLSTGNPVQLDGVDVGTVERIVLPRDPTEKRITVRIEVDRRYEARIRGDSQAHIKTLGLLGDKYVEIVSGTFDADPIEDGGTIPTAPATSVDELLASGEDVVDNVTAITFSLRNILESVERGEGLLGELTAETESGRKLSDELVATLDSVRSVVDKVDRGDGALPRLLNDRELADSLESSVDRLGTLLGSIEEGEGLVPGLLYDPATRERFDDTMTRLESTMGNLEALTADLESGDGLLPRLLSDEEYGREVSESLKRLLDRLNTTVEQLTEGEGTVAQLLNDPAIYDSLNDILIGIDESWMLRWLIRNRQKAGIEARYEAARDEEGDGGEGAGEDDELPPELRRRLLEEIRRELEREESGAGEPASSPTPPPPPAPSGAGASEEPVSIDPTTGPRPADSEAALAAAAGGAP